MVASHTNYYCNLIESKDKKVSFEIPDIYSLGVALVQVARLMQ